MKKVLLIFSLMALATVASAQTALYKKYAHRSDIRVYCVEHYPLSGGDTVTVTFIEADNDPVRNAIRQELVAIDPDRRKKKYQEKDFQLNLTSEEVERIDELIKKHKHVESFLSSPLPGDSGKYYVNCPSDRPVILVFHVYSDEQQGKVIQHIISTEFNTVK